MPILQLILLLFFLIVGLLILFLVVKLLILLIPAAIVALIVWFLTHNSMLTGIAFIIVVLLGLLK